MTKSPAKIEALKVLIREKRAELVALEQELHALQDAPNLTGWAHTGQAQPPMLEGSYLALRQLQTQTLLDIRDYSGHSDVVKIDAVLAER